MAGAPSLRMDIPLLLLALAVPLLAVLASAEGSPPEIVLDTPGEGARLGLTVVISGTATDADGFNASSSVQARWDDWEWFELPTNIANGTVLRFGQSVDLSWHAPGEHLLSVRAYDGEVYGEPAAVNVTVRDLPDLVVLPADILLDPVDAVAGERAEVLVTVRNQGGEDVADVEVTLRVDEVEEGRETLELVPAYGQAPVRFPVELGEGNVTLLVSANAMGQVQEKSQANNYAQRTLEVRGEDGAGMNLRQAALAMVIVVVFLLLVLGALRLSPRDDSRKP